MKETLNGRTILITGAARRLGRTFALACARAGADVVVHHFDSPEEADAVRVQIARMGRKAWVFRADFGDSAQARELIPLINEVTPLHGLINSAAVFEPLALEDTSPEDWQKHLQINLTAPFLLSQAFGRLAQPGARIINILDWRAMRPGADHFPYTVSKAALASMTKSLALALSPSITVNGLALGAILPPSGENKNPDILKNIPLKRWAKENEVEEALLFLLTCPPYITGEILHVDGGRHLV